MSQFVCLLHLDGRPAERFQLNGLVDTIDDLGPDGRDLHVAGPLGMGAAHFFTTPEAVDESLPLVEGDLALVFDGRLHNRDEIRRAVADRDVVVHGVGDGAHILAAYRRWGAEAPKHLLGDYAFVLWDSGERRLLASVDHIGDRRLRWFCDGRTFIASTVFPPILAHEDVPNTPNEGLIAEFLVGQPTTESETLYASVRQLQGGEQMELVPASHPRIRRYWSITDEIGRKQIRSTTAAAEELAHTLTEAVACRMRAHGGVTIDLSGGWDSSTMAVVAHDLHREGRCEDFDLRTETFPGTASDELEYVEAVERHIGRRATRVPYAKLDVVNFIEEMGRLGHPYPRSPVVSGHRVQITGDGGNETFGGLLPGFGEILDAVGSWDLALARRATRAALSPFIRPFVPRRVRLARTKLVHPWLDQAFVERVKLTERLIDNRIRPRRGTLRQRTIGEVLGIQNNGALSAYSGQLSDGRHAEVRNPCLDLRLIRLAMACSERIAGSVRRAPRRLHNAAFGTRLPSLVTERAHGVGFDHVLSDTLDSLSAGRETCPELSERGWVDVNGLARRPEAVRGQMALLLVYTCEVWIETLAP